MRKMASLANYHNNERVLYLATKKLVIETAKTYLAEKT